MASGAEDLNGCFEGVALEQYFSILVDGGVCLYSYIRFTIDCVGIGRVGGQFLDSNRSSGGSCSLLFAVRLHQ